MMNIEQEARAYIRHRFEEDGYVHEGTPRELAAFHEHMLSKAPVDQGLREAGKKFMRAARLFKNKQPLSTSSAEFAEAITEFHAIVSSLAERSHPQEQGREQLSDEEIERIAEEQLPDFQGASIAVLQRERGNFKAGLRYFRDNLRFSGEQLSGDPGELPGDLGDAAQSSGPGSPLNSSPDDGLRGTASIPIAPAHDPACPQCHGEGWYFVDEWLDSLQGRRGCNCNANPCKPRRTWKT